MPQRHLCFNIYAILNTYNRQTFTYNHLPNPNSRKTFTNTHQPNPYSQQTFTNTNLPNPPATINFNQPQNQPPQQPSKYRFREMPTHHITIPLSRDANSSQNNTAFARCHPITKHSCIRGIPPQALRNNFIPNLHLKYLKFYLRFMKENELLKKYSKVLRG